VTEPLKQLNININNQKHYLIELTNQQSYQQLEKQRTKPISLTENDKTSTELLIYSNNL
jgi:hypothetical protein